jgi:16S rRNA (adenine1518-N6/adenine1519-N6)-dimethyltransferase
MRRAARGRVIPLEPLREVIARYGLSASKSLGQNFLLDENLLDRIARVPGSLAGETVYEVGPGPGGLTRALLRAGAEVVAVERDQRCLAPLRELEAAFDGRLKIVAGDALAMDEAALAGPAHVVANLPYNVGTFLFVRWLGGEPWPPWWKSLTLMFQREVADRIVAAPGSSAYGRLSILAQWRSEAKLALKVHRSAFVPPPKIMSAVIHITPKAAPDGVAAADIERLTAAAFGQRRKMLRQSLKGVAGAIEALAQLGIDPARRAETLAVADYIAIARLIGN